MAVAITANTVTTTAITSIDLTETVEGAFEHMKTWMKRIKNADHKQFFAELKWLAAYTMRFPWAVVWYTVLGLVGTALGLTAGVFSKHIVDMVIGVESGPVVGLACGYVGLLGGKILLSAITGYISETIQIKVSQSIKAEIFDRMIRARWKEISRFHSGDLLARASRDTGTISGAVVGWIPSFLISLFQFVGAFALILYYDATLAWLALASAPVVLLLSGVTTRRMRDHSKEMRTLGAELTSFHAEAFQNLQIIKSFGVVSAYSKRLRQLQDRQKTASLQYKKFSTLTGLILSFAGVAVSCACFLWSAYRLWLGHITFGEMTLFLQLAGVLSAAFGALVGMVGSTITAATAAGRIMEVTTLPEEEYDNQEAVQAILARGGNLRLQMRDVDFAYDEDKWILQQGNLETQPGEIVVVMGPSGGGKTTLLRILLGIVDVQHGTVTVSDGETQLPVSPSTRSLFSYVPQDNTLFSGTIAENLRVMNPHATDEQLWDALRLACAEDFVRELGLDGTVGERGQGLSQGQMQRLSIARALLSDAPILLLDEATSALDLETEARLLTNLVSGQNGRTCLVTTHRLSVLHSAHKAYRVQNQHIQRLSCDEMHETCTADD